MTRGPAGGVAWWLVGAMIGSLIAASLPAGALCLAAAAVGAALAGAPWPSRRWFGLVGGGALGVWTLNACLVRGAALIALGPVAVTHEGIARGALVALRLIAAATALVGLRAAWPGERAADELARLLAPFERLGLPVARARAMLGLALRFAPLLADEARRDGADAGPLAGARRAVVAGARGAALPAAARGAGGDRGGARCLGMGRGRTPARRSGGVVARIDAGRAAGGGV